MFEKSFSDISLRCLTWIERYFRAIADADNDAGRMANPSTKWEKLQVKLTTLYNMCVFFSHASNSTIRSGPYSLTP